MTGKIKKVGVVGCGIMGGGIAQTCIAAGYPTVVREVNQQLLDKGMNAVRSNLAKAVERGKMTETQKSEALARLTGTVRFEDFKDCDLVIEAAIENIEEKRKVFSALDGVCPAHAILASNTSSLCIAEMAAATKRSDRVVGMHFFNPVPAMKMAEVVRGIASSDETIASARAFVESLGKTVVMAKDTPGFIVNRLLVPYLLDAVRVLESGVGSKEEIDQGMVLGCGHPMGPLTLIDLLGLDTTYYIAQAMYQEFGETRFAPPVLLKRMVLSGRLGRKTGRGFYDYTQQK
ncbi:MAG: 3-hydroxybutyryl-CoA dehydrogenase [Dehalococcoidia bacterium]|nr:3-hydroxybutyryl-CoA dehydrogenase [Dehalococcoidia bacterium]